MADQFKLTPEEVQTLRRLTPKLNAAKDTVERLAKLGIDVTEQRERIANAEQIRNGMIQEFSPTGVPRQP